MSAAAADRAVPVPERREIALLRAALDDSVLAGLGWDPEGLVVHTVSEHVSFGFAACEVTGCECPATRSQKLCGVCFARFERAVARGAGSDLEAFKQIPRRPPRQPERLCLVCRVAPDHQRPVERGGLCVAHQAHRRRLAVTVEEYVARDDVRPLPSLGVCRRDGCERVAAGRRQLCSACEKAWWSRGRPDLEEFCADRYAVAQLAMVAPIRLDGLPEQVVLELLYVAQKFTEIERKRCREGWRGMARDARAHRVGSLLELERGDATSFVLLTRRLAQRELDVLYADRETEFAADAWDLRKVGLAIDRHTAVLDFRTLRQRWLREAAKAWARVRVLDTQGNNLKAAILAATLLSDSLAERTDEGRDPLVLARADTRAFVERLDRLHRAGRLADTTYYRAAGKVRQLLRECRDFGLYEPGGPLHGLSAEFAVWLQDLPREPADEDEEGRALPQAVIDQLLSTEYLARLRDRDGDDVCTMLLLLADTGRRPGELARLRATCLEQTEFVDQHTGQLQSAWVLVHDMPKLKIKRHRLFIGESTAQLIIEQRERVTARFPDTPPSELALFPRERRNPHGIYPTWAGKISGAVRAWADALPTLTGPAGEEFPRERVIPYAFRHSFAQRHADNGTPLDVLAAMMGHRTTDTTRGYYRVEKSRMRAAVARVSGMQLNHRAHHVAADFAARVDAEYDRYQVGQIAVGYGTCHEPSNVTAAGQSCPYRFRCFGCSHFRTDPSYLPELRAHLQKLLVDHERLNAVSNGMLEDWARRDALPAPQEVAAVRRLIRAAEQMLDELDPAERASLKELFAVIRRARANIETALPLHMAGRVRQPQPTLHPIPASTRPAGSDR
jgi:integrase